VEGSTRGLIDVLFRHLSGGIEDNHEKPPVKENIVT
jgi:hypothetical protein